MLKCDNQKAVGLPRSRRDVIANLCDPKLHRGSVNYQGLGLGGACAGMFDYYNHDNRCFSSVGDVIDVRFIRFRSGWSALRDWQFIPTVQQVP